MNNGKGMGGRCIIGVAGWRNHPGQLRQSVRRWIALLRMTTGGQGGD